MPICTTSLTLSGARLAGMDARPVDEGAVGAVQILDLQFVVLEGDDGVLPRGPDAIRRLLVVQVDVHRLLVGAADEIVPFVDGVLDVALQATKHQQARLRAGRQSLPSAGGVDGPAAGAVGVVGALLVDIVASAGADTWLGVYVMCAASGMGDCAGLSGSAAGMA